MTRLFLTVTLGLLAFVGCENVFLGLSPHDVTALMLFFTLGFLGLAGVDWATDRQRSFRLTPLRIALTGFLLWTAAAGYYASTTADLSRLPALKTVSGLCFAAGLFLFLRTRERVREVLAVLLLCAGVHAGFGLLQQGVPGWQVFPDRMQGSSTSFFANPNFYSGYLVLHLPLAVYFYRTAGRRVVRAAAATAFVGMLTALGFSGSPGGQLVAAFQMMALAAFLAARRDRKALATLGAGLALAGVLYVDLVFFLKTPGAAAQTESWTGALIQRSWVGEHLANRWLYWQGAWKIFADHWLTGGGLWSFLLLYPQTGLPYSPPHAHSGYLQTLSDTGLPGFLLLAGVLGWGAAAVRRRFAEAGAAHRERVFVLALAPAALLVHNLFEYNWLVSGFIYYFVLWAAVLEAPESGGEESPPGRGFPVWRVATAVGILAAVGTAALNNHYRYHLALHVHPAKAATLEQVKRWSERAKQLCPRCGRPYRVLARGLLDGHRQTGDPALLHHAAEALNHAVTRDPWDPRSRLLLGEIRALQGRNEEARQAFAFAVRYGRVRAEAERGFRRIGLPPGS